MGNDEPLRIVGNWVVDLPAACQAGISCTSKTAVKITSKGQVRVPLYIRERLELLPGCEVEWELRDGAAVLTRARRDGRALVDHMRGRSRMGMTTDEIMELTRGES